MKHWLLWISLVLACSSSERTGAQYIFMDANADARCGPDYLPAADPPVDVYVDTSENAGGTSASCPGGEPLSMSWYEIIFRGQAAPAGAYVDFGTWTNAVASFTVDMGEVRGGNELRVGFAAANPADFLPPGRYKLGTLTVTMTGCSYLGFAASSPLGSSFVTGFYSECPGVDGEHLIKLGSDFDSNCGVIRALCSSVDDETATTWGRIKMLYR